MDGRGGRNSWVTNRTTFYKSKVHVCVKAKGVSSSYNEVQILMDKNINDNICQGWGAG